MEDTMIIERAIALAVHYHAGAERKADHSPYIVHPLMVGTQLAKHGFSDEVIAAGFCHDLLEDTNCPPEKIEKVCGPKVLEIVKAVSNDERLSDPKDWIRKKKAYIASVRNGPEGAKAVCLVDKIHNLTSLLHAYKTQGKEVWKHFHRGKKDKVWFESAVLSMLQETWNHPLIGYYATLIEQEKLLDG